LERCSNLAVIFMCISGIWRYLSHMIFLAAKNAMGKSC